MEGLESFVTTFASWLKLAVEALGAFIIGTGITVTVYKAVRTRFVTGRQAYRQTRLDLSHYLVLALEFQLAADILGTTVAPTWDQLGQLATIAVIRTFLNFFLQREIRELEQEGA